MIGVAASSIANHLGVTAVGPDLEVSRPTTVASAGHGNLAFATDTTLLKQALDRALERGAVVIIPTSENGVDPLNGTVIPVENPRAGFAQAVSEFFEPSASVGIASTAAISPEAMVDPKAYVGEFSVIRAGAVIGAYTQIRDHVVIGRGVEIGENSLIKSHAVIGEEGFGIERDVAGNNFPVPQIGSVRIGSYVQLGNFTTVCAGALEPTTVDDYVKVSDHVHVAHNCHIGRNSILTAGVVLSGRTNVEEGVWIGPGTTVRDGITIGANAFIGIGSNVVKSVPEGQTWAGNPARPVR